MPIDRWRFASTMRAMRGARAIASTESWDRTQYAHAQREALTQLVRHARDRSPFYRELYAGLPDDPALLALPPVDKPTLMARFDEWVTDPRIRLAGVREYLDSGTYEPYLGRFRVLSTGGSSRIPGIFVYDRDGWSMIMATYLYGLARAGIRPKLPRRRIAAITAPPGPHQGALFSRDSALGLTKALPLSASTPARDLVKALNRFQPDSIIGYPSILAVVAAEQVDGRLQIRPGSIYALGEPLTEPTRERITNAWGIRPYDGYGSTETGGIAGECDHHTGLHQLEHMVIYEVVDEHDHPVADGEQGHHALVTNLFNHAQPIIRYRLDDVTAIEPGPCPCGWQSKRLRPVNGRVDDLLTLPGINGSPVLVHPTTFAPLHAIDGVAEFQIVHRPNSLQVLFVPRPDSEPGPVSNAIRERVRTDLATLGVGDLQITTQQVDHLERSQRGGKLKLVRSELTPEPDHITTPS
jgi:phenylacetate-coenzyme A ligase PaaK-like adenylate-forming protein